MNWRWPFKNRRCRARKPWSRSNRCRDSAGHDGRHDFGWANIGYQTINLDAPISTTARSPLAPGSSRE